MTKKSRPTLTPNECFAAIMAVVEAGRDTSTTSAICEKLVANTAWQLPARGRPKNATGQDIGTRRALALRRYAKGFPSVNTAKLIDMVRGYVTLVEMLSTSPELRADFSPSQLAEIDGDWRKYASRLNALFPVGQTLDESTEQSVSRGRAYLREQASDDIAK